MGPYRLCIAAVENCRNAVTVAGGSASPATRTARSEAHSAELAAPANTDSIDGTNEVMVTRCRPMISDRYSGSRCPSGAAISMRAPTASVPNSSHTDTSKVTGVFCSTTSAGFIRYSAVIQAIWFTTEAWLTATPFGRPVEPEV
ncbi:hypothetical protein FMUBM48_48920 [Nocardia cyriacigeorgica]|nr:hypothetical protein FMUBM48_48920 [Nocardia cyriacigeorgica]